ncbi:hypothetical protein SLEP1_g53971 [Rubroshorea leprosula]|uniref:Uncharacterized protein n=1 Tax=Rubroshorea leprosula TaxID=152421 RepID=A0AAV5MBD3_9ROSI|nr:hypothetical protein SLEP1_g53971 [Rubroshorea leprosula]
MPSTDADFDLRQSPQSAFSMGDYTFADAGNLEHCAKYLNQTLVTFGFPSSLDLFANDPFSGHYSSDDEQVMRISKMVATHLQHPARRHVIIVGALEELFALFWNTL